ncbi:YdeI/OmpD-associated family protein [Paenibacillus sp. J5C_2022]|uniref:YdeI/OmpD-associated family protein n=1 Tax=Paenibacillus sp. J5C2022 TaxID=2977129 RepID=UPI0021CF3667|nr:YdeI/OmpD-associated family protein [Paenibacillus sp. J5C2022]MCU6709966.1 YdeI/OmpD-associated family protein [Paenibacillus sp. J5C2022]
MKSIPGELPIMRFDNAAAFQTWLEQNYNDSAGIRLQIAKKNAKTATVTYQEALDEALCYGWIDSQKEKLDEQYYLQRFTPRKPSSIWSKINKDKAEALIQQNRMKHPGYAAIEIAKKNDMWNRAYESQSHATVPDDFAELLLGHPNAKTFFDMLDKQNRYAIIFRINNVKRLETRQKKMQAFIEMLERGEKIY